MGSNPSGWSGKQNENSGPVWQSARHALDAIPVDSRGSVRFRFSLASRNDSDKSDYIGFAFDDFTIQNREKNILVEQFVSVSRESVGNDFNKQSRVHLEEVKVELDEQESLSLDQIVMTYHTDLAGDDIFNHINDTDPSARAAYYGINQVGSILDGVLGGISADVSQDPSEVTWTNRELGLQALEDNKFDITIVTDLNASATEIKGSVLFAATESIAADTELRAYIAILEDSVSNDAGSSLGVNFSGVYEGFESGFANVTRKLLPDGSGEFVKLTEELGANEYLMFGESNQLDFQWDLVNVFDDSELAAVVFIQDNLTKEIYQAEVILKGSANSIVSGKNTTGVLSIDESAFIHSDYAMYPNPTDSEVFIKFDDFNHEAFAWTIYDQTGRVFEQGTVNPGEFGFSVDTQLFPSGLYFMSIAGQKTKFEFKKLMVTH